VSGSDQRVEQTWTTPAPDEIVELTRAHVAAMETLDGDAVWQQAGMHHLRIPLVRLRESRPL
jgi:hypothetical protein